MNAANAITLFRLCLVPVVLFQLMSGAFHWALWTFVTASVSDGLDGFIARHFNQRTHIGAVLDPLADKLLILACVLGLTWIGLLPLWLAFLIIGRDFVIVTGAVSYRLAIGPYHMAPTYFGKACTFAQFFLILLVLAGAAGYYDRPAVTEGAIALTAALTLISGAHYVWVWGRKAGENSARGTPPSQS